MPQNPKENEELQHDLLSALAKIACAASGSLQASTAKSGQSKTLQCALCDAKSSTGHCDNIYWNDRDVSEDWKESIAAMLAIIKEPKFQESPKARILMAVAIGRVFTHISDTDYLNLEICGLGQWLLGSMSRSLRELKIAAT